MTSISSISSAIPTDVLGNIIFRNLSLPALGICSRVCKIWREIAEKQINTFFPEKAFGPKEWFIYFGAHLKNVPPLPPNITEILSSPCPFLSSKKVHETHLLVLVPETLGDQPLTLKTLGEIVKKPLTGSATQYRSFELGEYTDPAAPPSHWVLLTRDVIEGSRYRNYPDQQTLLSQKGHGIYAVPTILDATVCIFMEYVRSGTWLYADMPNTYVRYAYVRCQKEHNVNWQLVVGGFAPEGLIIRTSYGSVCEIDGVAGSRKI
jgi:hypothetical protein